MALPQVNTLANAGVSVLCYTVPASMQALLTINITAHAASNVTIWLAPPTGALANSQKIEDGTTLTAKAVLERGNILLPAGWRVFVMSDTANAASYQIWGLEEATT